MLGRLFASRRHAAGALVLLACPSSSPRPALDPPPRAAAEPATEAQQRPAAHAPADPPKPDVAPPPDAATPGPLDYAASLTGVLVVWSRHDGETSEIVAQQLDPRGSPLAPPRHVLRTEGEIVDLAVSTAKGHAWLAYVAEIEAPSGLLGAAVLAPDLSVTGARVLDRFTADALSAWGGDRVRVLALAPDDAVIAAIGAPVQCRDRVVGGTRACPGYHLYTMRGGDFKDNHVAEVGVDGGQSDMGALVDVGAGVLLDVWAWHGGPSHADLYLPRGATKAATPKFRRVRCRPPFRRGFDGEALVSWCAGDDAGLDERCRLSDDPAARCTQLHLVTLKDRVLTPRSAPQGAPLTALTLRCSAGRPVLDVAWDGGSRRLDPQAPGAALDLRPELGVWTGEYGVQIAEDGQITRYRCQPDERLEQGPVAPLDLAAPASA
ncbi:hypothetical protein OV203_15680 [Nannocystis sp. ILAH1]|uniref:hypothetical protein n=1 Tax=Nannocystis sp. ILAH1 TaxID=2996789 RepID=UPI00227184E3|nr:hypothetical protein [Nannocystis sp. ILAH1]MCY0988573.1 hypothetical protein [Nannocystis sp. ILAH1]